MNQGYFLELTSKDSELFEEFLAQQDFTELSAQEQEKFAIVRRQTLKGNQRYTSPYLDNLQSHILGAKEQLKAKESAVLQGLQQSLLESITPLYSLAEKLAWLDLFTSQAIFARDYHCREERLPSSPHPRPR